MLELNVLFSCINGMRYYETVLLFSTNSKISNIYLTYSLAVVIFTRYQWSQTNGLFACNAQSKISWIFSKARNIFQVSLLKELQQLATMALIVSWFVTIFWTSHWFRSNSTIVSKNVRFFLLRFPKKALKFRNIEAKEKSDSKKCLKRNRQFTPSQACLLRKHFLNLIANTVNNRHQFFPQKLGIKKLNHVNLIWVRNFTLLLKMQ